MEYPVLVIGAGASGLAAAISAAESGASVCVLEKKEQPLKKLLLTGNGRCNFTNRSISSDAYYTHEPAFIERFLRRFQTEDALLFFRGLGLYPAFRGDYVYPMSMQAQSVREALLARARAHSVNISCGVNVKDVTYDSRKKMFTVKTSSETYSCRKLILSCGSEAGVRDREAFTADQILRKLGHRLYPVRPALVKLLGNVGYESFWDGVRHHCIVRFVRKSDGAIFTEEGEVQFTKDGISGIPVFQISHPAGEEIDQKGKASVRLNFIPDLGPDGLRDSLNLLKNSPYQADRTFYDILTGFLPKKLIKAVLAQTEGMGSKKIREISDEEIRKLSELLSDFPYTVTGVGDAMNAQVMRGGADLSEFTDDLESRIVPGLYVTGELLDVDGKCGGYNLHFAWGTGILAGRSAAENLSEARR